MSDHEVAAVSGTELAPAKVLELSTAKSVEPGPVPSGPPMSHIARAGVTLAKWVLSMVAAFVVVALVVLSLSIRNTAHTLNQTTE